MEFNFDLINIFILLVLVSNSLLGLFIFLSKKKDIINRNFFVFSITATSWGLTMFLFRSFPDYDSGFFAKVLYASASTIPFVFLYFIRVFPSEKWGVSKRVIQVLSVPFLLVFSMSLLTDYLVINSFSVAGHEPVIIFNNFYHTLYAIYINVYFLVCYIVLFIKLYKSRGIEKVQMAYVITGTLVGTIIGVSTNLTMPYLGNFSLNWMGQIGVISMVGAIAYSIMKHKLFDMKVLATQFTVVVLCISLFTKVLFSVDDRDLIINSVFLFITMIVGVFLIRSVIKEVRQREQIEKLANDLKLANQGQASLMHFMNHQVKGKFGNARNIFAELLTEDYGVMPPDAKPLLEKGLDETRKGVDYVQNILKGASAENGTLPFDMQKMDYKSVVNEVVDRQKEYAEKKGLKLELNIEDGEYGMTGDAVQLGEATKNMIDNSINYTESGGIKITLRNSPTHKNNIRLEVKDTGVGLSDEDKTKLFKSGGRGTESLKVNVNSTGYGLVFVKGVVEAHKGMVWAESQGRGKGSTFVLELPRS